MPIVYSPGLARFEDTCGPEEAEAFLDWIRSDPRLRVDLSAAASLHAALLQVLLAGRPALTAEPGDPFLAAILADLAVRPDQSGPDTGRHSSQPSNRVLVS